MARYRLQQKETEADVVQLSADFESFQLDMKRLEALERQNRATLKLYPEQVQAGSIPITHGFSLYRESGDTRLAAVDVHTHVNLNCLQAALLFRGDHLRRESGND